MLQSSRARDSASSRDRRPGGASRWVKRQFWDRIPIHAKRIYIVPTSVGIYFGVVTFSMLLIGAGYNNNLVNMLAFFMFALIFVSMVVTQAQLQGLELIEAESIDAFEGQPLEVSIRVSNSTVTDKFGMEWKWSTSRAEVQDRGSGLQTVRARPGGRVSWTLQTRRRGCYTLKQVVMSSVFPLGLFYAWKKLELPLTIWVYPRPEGPLPLEGELLGESEGQNKETENLSKTGGDDFRGHRKYQPGDSSRRVDWKAYARSSDLLVKEMSEPDHPELDLAWARLPEQWEVEAKLSQLAKWIQLAIAQDRHFVLTLPHGLRVRSSSTDGVRRCLRALAEFESEQQSE
jgi:uncharacterized protein (DUF58 family)